MSTGLQTELTDIQAEPDGKASSESPSFTGNATLQGSGAIMQFISPSMTNALTFSFNGFDVDGVTPLQRGYIGVPSASTPTTIALASTRGDIDLRPKPGFYVNTTATIKESGVLLSDKYAPLTHNHAMEEVTGLTEALSAIQTVEGPQGPQGPIGQKDQRDQLDHREKQAYKGLMDYKDHRGQWPTRRHRFNRKYRFARARRSTGTTRITRRNRITGSTRTCRARRTTRKYRSKG